MTVSWRIFTSKMSGQPSEMLNSQRRHGHFPAKAMSAAATHHRNTEEEALFGSGVAGIVPDGNCGNPEYGSLPACDASEGRHRAAYRVAKGKGGLHGDFAAKSPLFFSSRLPGQRIRVGVRELHFLTLHTLPAFDVPYKVCAVVGPHRTALPSSESGRGIRIIEVSIQTAGVEAERIGHAHRNPLAGLRIAVAETLNLIEAYEKRTGARLSSLDQASYLHWFSEATATAFADRNR